MALSTLELRLAFFNKSSYSLFGILATATDILGIGFVFQSVPERTVHALVHGSFGHSNCVR